MKSTSNLISTLTFVLVICCRLNAQYVTIPDANFVIKLQQLFPGAMNGNQMDTTHAQIVNCTNLNLSSLSLQSIDGIQYFDALEMLNCDQNNLTSLPPLPSSLEFLHCSNNQLTGLPQLNQTALIQLHCSGNQLSSLPTLPASLTVLFCSSNPLTYLPNLPSSLLILESQSCQLFSLPNLPIGLIELWCASNQLTSLPTLPALNILCCANNSISCLPIIPSSIDFFPGFDLSLAIIDGNPLSCIPNETPYFNQLTTGLPLCLPNDPVTNPNNCLTVLLTESLVTAPVFHVYPNPTNGNFTIESQKEQLGSALRVMDISGKIVLQTQLTTTTQTITSELDGGVYLVTLENDASGVFAQKRLVVSK